MNTGKHECDKHYVLNILNLTDIKNSNIKPVKEVAVSIMVNPSQPSTLRRGPAHVAVLHHPARGKLVEVALGKVDAGVGFDNDDGKEGEEVEHDWLHVLIVWGLLLVTVALMSLEAAFIQSPPDYHLSSRIAPAVQIRSDLRNCKQDLSNGVMATQECAVC